MKNQQKKCFKLSDEDIKYSNKVNDLVLEELKLYQLRIRLDRHKGFGLGNNRLISNRDEVIHHYSDGRLTNEDLESIMKSELKYLASEEFHSLRFEYATDHVRYPEYLGYGMLNNIFSSNQMEFIKTRLDHEDTLESFPKVYGGDIITIQSELDKVFLLDKEMKIKSNYSDSDICYHFDH